MYNKYCNKQKSIAYIYTFYNKNASLLTFMKYFNIRLKSAIIM